jgi:hypothetical protein
MRAPETMLIRTVFMYNLLQKIPGFLLSEGAQSDHLGFDAFLESEGSPDLANLK